MTPSSPEVKNQHTPGLRDAVKWLEDMGYGSRGRFSLSAKREWSGYEIKEILELFAAGFPESGRTEPESIHADLLRQRDDLLAALQEASAWLAVSGTPKQNGAKCANTFELRQMMDAAIRRATEGQ